MPRRCIIAVCNTEGKQRRSLYHFPKDEAACAKWVKAVREQRLNWKGNIDGSLIHLMHLSLNALTQSLTITKNGSASQEAMPHSRDHSNYFPQA